MFFGRKVLKGLTPHLSWHMSAPCSYDALRACVYVLCGSHHADHHRLPLAATVRQFSARTQKRQRFQWRFRQWRGAVRRTGRLCAAEEHLKRYIFSTITIANVTVMLIVHKYPSAVPKSSSIIVVTL